MTVVSVLRELWSRRLLVAVGLALALGVATLMAFSVTLGVPPDFKSRQYIVGIASSAVLIDSPSSQVADLGGGSEAGPQADVGSLSARARLLANLMSTSPLKDRIARRAGIAPSTLIARAPAGPGITTPDPATPLSTGSTISPSDPNANILTITVNETLPILSADSQAPDTDIAAKISAAAVTELPLYLRSVASTDRVPNAQQLVVKPLGPARYATVQHGPRRMFAIIAAIVLFCMWCAGILVIAGFARAWKQADEDESRGGPLPTTATSQTPPELLTLPPGPRPERVRSDPSGLSERPERPERASRNRVA
jgi:hypothetical protein